MLSYHTETTLSQEAQEFHTELMNQYRLDAHAAPSCLNHIRLLLSFSSLHSKNTRLSGFNDSLQSYITQYDTAYFNAT